MSDRHITIRKNKVPYKETLLPFDHLAFYPENPRVYSQLKNDEECNQAAILDRMTKMDYVKELRKEIDRDGQVNEPLYVMPIDAKDELSASYDHIVLEGNSRLAALKLNKPGSLPQPKVLCKVLDFSNFDNAKRESLIFSLLGQLHLRGKKDWGAYENAGFFHRRHKNHEVSLQELANETGLNITRIRNAVHAYDLMAKYKDETQSNFSYYQAYESASGLRKHRNTLPNLDNTVASYIKDGKFPEARDMRHLATILDDKPARKAFLDIEAEDPFGDALSIVQQGGKNDTTYRRLRGFRRWLADKDTKRKIERLRQGTEKQRKDTEFELKKIASIANQLGPRS